MRMLTVKSGRPTTVQAYLEDADSINTGGQPKFLVQGYLEDADSVTWRRRTVASASARRVECACSRSRRRLASSSSNPTTSSSRSSAALSIYSEHASVSVRIRPYCQCIGPPKWYTKPATPSNYTLICNSNIYSHVRMWSEGTVDLHQAE